MFAYTMPVFAFTKDETVYSKIDSNGNNLVWHAEGSDIYYQGESQKELPIECNVKYELDGNEITASELAGKSGKVKITIEYINKDAHTVKINGKNQTLYTPFVVVCGTIIDNTNNRNIEIINGKTIDDGSKTTVIGISLPGMQESLNISKDKICDYINGDLKDISARLEKLQELSEEYNNFTMLNNGDKGNVKFIMIMDSIKKEEDSKQDIILDDKQK